MVSPEPCPVVRIAIVAGEPSGDNLAAELITTLRQMIPTAQFTGIAGKQMQAVGCESLVPIEKLSVMGISDVLKCLPELLRVRRYLIQELLSKPPDLYIGIDAPDFNLRIERHLRRMGIMTAHVVSPSVWAWRQSRMRLIRQACDHMFALFPFEKPYYDKQQMACSYVGHPIVSQFAKPLSKTAARQSLSLSTKRPTITLLPGSRQMEIKMMLPLFLDTVCWYRQKHPDVQFVLAAANETIAQQITALAALQLKQSAITLVVGQAHAAITAGDVVLVTSGTATLETMLLNRPMVVAYKMSCLNYAIAKTLVNVSHFALPNLLAEQCIVPEFLQSNATSVNLGQALEYWMTHPDAVSMLLQTYHACKKDLQRDTYALISQKLVAMLATNRARMV